MVESKIRDLFQNGNTVYIFDVDGVLARLEYGEYNHYYYDDEAWSKMIYEKDYYKDVRAFETMQKFLANKDMKRVYVATKVMNEEEHRQKVSFLNRNYGILADHVFLVYQNDEKLDVILKIKENYPNLEDKYFVMIDDSVDGLNHIMANSSFSTDHVSSFIE